MSSATAPVLAAVRALAQRILSLGENPQLMGVTELEIREIVREMACLLEEAVFVRQAERLEAVCPDCGEPLVRRKRRSRQFQTIYGAIRVEREYGYCRQCAVWVAPADTVWGLQDQGELSPLLCDGVSWMATVVPAVAVSQALEKMLGVPVCPAQVDRVTKRVGARAVAARHQETDQALDVEQRGEVARAARQDVPANPFVLVIMIDGWMIRERLPEAGWHEVKSATVFRLDQRGRSGARPIILEREYVATRAGPEVLSELVWAAALRRGLVQAQQVLLVADGAAWIWAIQQDRFSDAQGILDFSHAVDHLWAVAHELYGEGTEQARQWVEPLRHQLRHGGEAGVIRTLEQLQEIVNEAAAQAVVQREANYFKTHRDHIGYEQYAEKDWPLGSGAIESTCNQFQTRFKRPGQFWTLAGDEPLLCLTCYRLSDRWQHLWPHLQALEARQN